MANEALQIIIGADTKDMSAALRQARKEIDDFEKKIGLIAPSSAKAGLALSNLGRVASDAPFGFIAIQNNIEPLLQSFQSLSKESGGTGGALKALGASLAGPTGILLGFSLVSSAITVAIQKYGSLGAALDALFGKQDALNGEIRAAAESYEKYSKAVKSVADVQAAASGSVQGEISRVKTLAAIVSDTTKTYSDRNNALKELEKINDKYFGNLDLESVKLGKLTTAVNAYTQATIQSAITKGFESEIGAANVELNKQENILRKLQDRTRTLQAAPQRIVGLAANVDTRDLVAATDAERQQAVVVTDLRARIRELNTAIEASINRYNALTAPVNAAADAQKKNEEAQKKAAQATKKNNAELERQAEIDRKRIERLDRLMETRPTFAPIAGINLQPDIPPTTLLNIDAQTKQIRDRYREGLKPLESIGAQIVNTIPKLDTKNFVIIPPESVQNAIDALNKIKIKADEITSAFSTFVAPAIDSVFNAIENGQSVIEALGQTFKKLIIDLVKATVKAAALALIISAVTGTPFQANFQGALSATGGGGFSLPKLGKSAAPTFSGASGFGGGLQLAGQVVFTQRGTDLVGVLNNSNARINRVG